MIYDKPFLSIEAQADLLIQRGLAGDRQQLIDRLNRVGFYRLSAYWYPFRQFDPTQPGRRLSQFNSNATLDDVWYRYLFDRKLRLCVMDAVERFEVFLRAHLAHVHAAKYGPFGYALDPGTLPRLSLDEHSKFRQSLQDQLRRSEEGFVQHFRTNYTPDQSDLPIWMASELLTLGALFTFYRGCEPDIQRSAAQQLGVHDTVLYSWLKTFNVIRNICAHHARLWNRELSVKPKIPNRDSRWHRPVAIHNHRAFAILTICKYCLNIIAPGSNWSNRLQDLLTEFPRIPVVDMGIPRKWMDSPLWSP